MGTHLIVLSESYPVNTNMTGLRSFSKIFASLRFGRKWPYALSIGRVKNRETTSITYFIETVLSTSEHQSLTNQVSQILEEILIQHI